MCGLVCSRSLANKARRDRSRSYRTMLRHWGSTYTAFSLSTWVQTVSFLGLPAVIASRSSLMFHCWCFFIFFHHEILELPWPIGESLPHGRMWVQFYNIVPSQNLKGPSPKKFATIMCIIWAISDNFRLWLWIFLEQIRISKIEQCCGQELSLMHLMKKTWWTLVH